MRHFNILNFLSQLRLGRKAVRCFVTHREKNRCEHNHNWIAFDCVARLGAFYRSEEQRAEYNESHQQAYECEPSRAQHAEEGGCDVSEVQQTEGKRDRQPLFVIVEFPPARVWRKEFGAGTQPHVCDTGEWQYDIVP